jgi:CRP-like cAMP-binding protein
MAIDALVKPFLRLPLFQGLKPLQLTEIVRRAERIIFKPGDTIIEEDKVGDAAIVIVSGDAVVIRHGSDAAAAEPVAEGSIVGELAMLVETVHTATVIAKGPVRALRLTRAEMHDLMAEDPRLAEHLTQKITARLHTLAGELRAIDQALAEIAAFDPFASSPGQSPHLSAAMH